MSILNVYRTDHRALICVDTLGVSREGLVEATKLHVLTRHHAILAYRGRAAFGASLAMLVSLAEGDFDALIRGMPHLLPAARTMAQSLIDAEAQASGNDSLMAGGRASRNRVVRLVPR